MRINKPYKGKRNRWLKDIIDALAEEPLFQDKTELFLVAMLIVFAIGARYGVNVAQASLI